MHPGDWLVWGVLALVSWPADTDKAISPKSCLSELQLGVYWRWEVDCQRCVIVPGQLLFVAGCLSGVRPQGKEMGAVVWQDECWCARVRV